MLVLCGGSVQAQVIEAYGMYGNVPVVTYMNELDSMVYVPEQDWSVSARTDSFYTDENGVLHAMLAIKIGPNANMAKVAFGLHSAEQVAYDSVTTIPLVAGTTQMVEFALEGNLDRYGATIVTQNAYHSGFNIMQLGIEKPKEYWEWESLGMVTLEENYMWGGSGESEIFRSKTNSNYYRIHKPFHNIMIDYGEEKYPAYMFSIWSNDASEYLTFRVIESGETVMGSTVQRSDLVYFEPCNIGFHQSSYGADVKIYHPSAGFSGYETANTWTYSRVIKYGSDGKTPTKIQLAPFYYMDGVGGWDCARGNDMIVITFPGYEEDVYTPTVYTPTVFEYDYYQEKADVGTNVKVSETYKSLLTETAKDVALYKGTLNINTDIYEAKEMGVPYYLENAYGTGANLYFMVDDNGKIVIPNEIKKQPIGYVENKKCYVYALINAEASTFDPNIVTLNVTYQKPDGTDLGTMDEVWERTTTESASFVTVGTLDYECNLYWQSTDGTPFLFEGLELQQNTGDPTSFRARGWGDLSIDFYFTWDKETNMLTVPEQKATYYSSYGYIYIADVATYTSGSYEEWPCVYDPSTQTATINVIYFVPDVGYFGLGPEKMYIHLNEMPAQENAAAKVKSRSLKTVVKDNKPSRLPIVPAMIPFKLNQDKASEVKKVTETPWRIMKPMSQQ